MGHRYTDFDCIDPPALAWRSLRDALSTHRPSAVSPSQTLTAALAAVFRIGR